MEKEHRKRRLSWPDDINYASLRSISQGKVFLREHGKLRATVRCQERGSEEGDLEGLQKL